MPRGAALASTLVLATLAGVASADVGRGRVGSAPLAAGEGWVALVVELSLSTRAVGEPWAAGVDAAVALSPRLTVGLSHSAGALGTVDRSGGVCLDSRAHDCPQRYRGGALDVRWRVLDGAAGGVTALARAGVAGVDPLLPYARLGLRGATGSGRWWAVASPELTMSLGGREHGNRDALEAPVWLGVDLGPASAWLRGGVRGELPDFGARFEVPVALGVAVGGRHWRAGADAGWTQLLGPQNSFKRRQAALWLALEL